MVFRSLPPRMPAPPTYCRSPRHPADWHQPSLLLTASIVLDGGGTDPLDRRMER
jgi:hypothetical protein